MSDDTTINTETGEETPLGLPPGHPLAVKLARIMRQVHSVTRSGVNEHFGYTFASEADYYEACRGPIAAENIAIIPNVLHETVTRRAIGEKGEWLTELFVEFTIIDGDSGVRERACYPGAGTDKADKGAYKAVTGATKYFLQKLLLIPSVDDPEAEPRGGDRAPRRPARAAATPHPSAPRPLGAGTVRHNPNGTSEYTFPDPPARPTTPVVTGAAARELVADPTPAPAPLPRPHPAPRANGPRPLATPSAPPEARALVADAPTPDAAEPAVLLRSVTFLRGGNRPVTNEPYKLYQVITETGQKLAAFDEVGFRLGLLQQTKQRVRLLTEATKYGPKITEFQVVREPARGAR